MRRPNLLGAFLVALLSAGVVLADNFKVNTEPTAAGSVAPNPQDRRRQRLRDGYGPPPAAEAETTPATIFGSKLVAWYRPDTGHVSVDGSNFVTQLDDRSGNGHHLDVVGGTPLLVDVSGTPAIDLEVGDGDYLGRASDCGLSAEPFAAYAVVDFESNAAEMDIWSLSASGSAQHNWNFGINATPRAYTRTRSTVNGIATHGTNLSTGTRYAVHAAWTASNARASNVGGGTEATNSTGISVGATNQVSIGSRRADAASLCYDGRIYDVVILNAAPSAGENTAYLAYTTSRFGTP